jgi:hypothetical protein
MIQGIRSFIHSIVDMMTTPNERAFLWRAADTQTLLNGTAALTGREF